MNKKSLLDTDSFSEITKGIDPVVLGHAQAYLAVFGRFTFTTIGVMEVLFGLRRRRSVRRLKAFLTSLPTMEILVFDETSARLAGEIAADLEQVGQVIGFPDTMVAAIAIESGLQLVTGNTAHFQRIQQLGYPLLLTNWRVP